MAMAANADAPPHAPGQVYTDEDFAENYAVSPHAWSFISPGLQLAWSQTTAGMVPVHTKSPATSAVGQKRGRESIY